MLCDDVVCQLGPALISGRLCQLGPARYDPVLWHLLEVVCYCVWKTWSHGCHSGFLKFSIVCTWLLCNVWSSNGALHRARFDTSRFAEGHILRLFALFRLALHCIGCGGT